VCSAAPWEGHPVAYAPRRVRDPLPWVLTGKSQDDPYYRYGGRFCHSVHGMLHEHVWYAPSNARHGEPDYVPPALVYVSDVDEKAGTAQVKADHWEQISTVTLDRLFLPKNSR
jgi:hypothetical protein